MHGYTQREVVFRQGAGFIVYAEKVDLVLAGSVIHDAAKKEKRRDEYTPPPQFLHMEKHDVHI